MLQHSYRQIGRGDQISPTTTTLPVKRERECCVVWGGGGGGGGGWWGKGVEWGGGVGVQFRTRSIIKKHRNSLCPSKLTDTIVSFPCFFTAVASPQKSEEPAD